MNGKNYSISNIKQLIDISKNLSITFEDGDMIKWEWEGTNMSGIIREETPNVKLFVIDKVKTKEHAQQILE